MFVFEYNYKYVKIRTVVFLLQLKDPFVATQGTGARHVARTCFYSSPEWTNLSFTINAIYRKAKT